MALTETQTPQQNALQLIEKIKAAHDANDPDILLMLIAQQRVGNRPGRIEPTNLKRRPKAFP